MVPAGWGRDGIGLHGSAPRRFFPRTAFIAAILVGASILQFSSTGLPFFTVATTACIVSASFTNLMDMVLSHPEASAVEDAGVGFAAGAFVADVIVNRKTGTRFRSPIDNETFYMQLNDDADNHSTAI